MVHHALRHQDKESLHDYYEDGQVISNSAISGPQAGPRNRPSYGFHIQAGQKTIPTHDHQHGLVEGI